jgi:hypothetical protein
MTNYYDITTTLRTELENDALINKVSKGGLDDIANWKKQEYALAHLIVNNCTPDASSLVYNVSIICMDIVDISKDETTDKFIGNDNEDDVLNNMLSVQIRLYEKLRRGDLFTSHYTLGSSVSIEPFTDRFEDKVAGWTMTIDIVVPNTMTKC